MIKRKNVTKNVTILGGAGTYPGPIGRDLSTRKEIGLTDKEGLDRLVRAVLSR